MNKLTIAFVAAASLLTVAGCKKKGGSDALAKMEGFSKQMCDCKDKACADKVNEEMTKWGTEMAKNAGKGDEKPDPEMAKKSADIMTKYTECMTKLMMAGAGGGGDMAGSAAAGGGDKGSDTGSAAAGGSDDKGAAGSDDKKDDDKKDDGSAAK